MRRRIVPLVCAAGVAAAAVAVSFVVTSTPPGERITGPIVSKKHASKPMPGRNAEAAIGANEEDHRRMLIVDVQRVSKHTRQVNQRWRCRPRGR